MEKDETIKTNQSKHSKLLILTRHGQRIDLSQLKKLQKHPKDDPELTAVGREQAVKMGKIIKKYVQDLNDFEQTSFLIVTSPFSRTLQTTIGLIEGYEFKEYALKVDNRLCEVIFPEFVDGPPSDYLCLYNKPKVLNSEIGNKNINGKEEYRNHFEELEKMKLTTVDSLSTTWLPTEFENESQVIKRLQEILLDAIEQLKTNNIVQLVSHAGCCSELRNMIFSQYIKEQNYIPVKHYYFNYTDSDVFEIEFSNINDTNIKFLTKLSLFN